MTPNFNGQDLVVRVEALTDAARHALPFGVIKLDANDTVTFYSEGESQGSGRKKRPTVGLNFFTDVAPCMDSPEMRGRIATARQQGTLDIEIGWIGDFDDPDGEIQIRAMSASDGGVWLFMNRIAV